MSDPQVHGVLVTFRRPSDLQRSLVALSRQTRPLDTLHVVNNDPERPVEVEVGALSGTTQVVVLDTGENLGPAGGIASGMEAALAQARAADFLLVLDDDDPLVDDRVVEDLLDAARTATAERPRLGGVGLQGACLDRRRGRLHRSPTTGATTVDYLMSNWAPLYTVDALRQVGVFRRDLFFGFDDLEFGLRLTNAGYPLEAHPMGRVEPEPPVRASLGFRRAPWRTYYTVRNLVVILADHATLRLAARTALTLGVAKPMVNLLRAPRSSRRQVWMSVRAVLDAVLGRMGCTVPPLAAKTS
jgi:GT2 family glycosyltransferase